MGLGKTIQIVTFLNALVVSICYLRNGMELCILQKYRVYKTRLFIRLYSLIKTCLFESKQLL